MNLKSATKLCLLSACVGWYLHYFYYNPKGILHQHKLVAENAIIKESINALTNEIVLLKSKTRALQSNRFEQEKIMRQDLQMSYTNEYVYLLPKK